PGKRRPVGDPGCPGHAHESEDLPALRIHEVGALPSTSRAGRAGDALRCVLDVRAGWSVGVLPEDG
ncbi:hypothetical protein, partial [Micromonospora sp. S-DT3-3-22]|uniref:hypothetical protein n=1 Tax=Micromonospora sp. S-DT3-3-22 TaxID=2755359 RepID=UPI001E55ED62